MRGRGLRAKYLLLCCCTSWFPLIWYAKWPCSEKVEFWPFDPNPWVKGVPRGGGGGGTLIFSHILGPGYFLGFKILNFNIFGGFWEKCIFWGGGGVEDFVDIFGGHHKIGLVWGSFLCISGYFLKSRYRIGIYFLVAKFQIFFWVLEIPDNFLGWTVDAGSEPRYTEKNWVHPAWGVFGLQAQYLRPCCWIRDFL